MVEKNVLVVTVASAYHQAVNLAPRDAIVRRLLGNALRQVNLSQAIEHLRIAFELGNMKFIS